MADGPNLAMARAAWSELPDWIEALARECDASSQTQAAERIGVSAGAVNALLRHRYQASTAKMEARVRGHLMAATVSCPVLGELATDQCQEWQDKSRTYAATSSLRVRMMRACRACPLNRKKANPDAEQ